MSDPESLVTTMRRLAWMLMGAALLLAVAPATASAEPQEDWMLHVRKEGETYSYVPGRVEVYAGAEVTLGHIFARHSIVAVDGSFNSTGDASEWPRIRAPSEAGEYPFYCWLHADAATVPGEGMAGVLVVSARPAIPAQVEPAGETPTREVSGPAPAALLVALAGGLALRRRHE